MTKEDIKSAILVLSREKECVQQAINNSMEGTGYVSPDGLIHADPGAFLNWYHSASSPIFSFKTARAVEQAFT